MKLQHNTVLDDAMARVVVVRYRVQEEVLNLRMIERVRCAA